MSPRDRDEEAAGGNAVTAPIERYRDESDEDSVGPDAPLRPSAEFDGLGRSQEPSWRERIGPRIPYRLKNAWRVTVIWVKGPQPPRIFKITPFFPRMQHAPIALLDRYAPKRNHRFWLLIFAYASWLLVFSLFLWKSSFAAQIPGYGSPVRLSCAARYWNEGNECGINGDQCRPFANSTLAFRCPADCHKTHILTPHAVGDQEVVYKSLVVGGPMDQQTGFEGSIVNNAVYRGDSFICASAVHSGFIKDIEGGCGVLTLTGEQSRFPGSKRNDIESVGFDSYFPRSFGFLTGSRSECKDLRWPTLAPTLIFTILISVFTTNPAVHFWSLFVALFFHVALVSDPPSLTNYYGLLSTAFGRFLPACFCSWVTYRYTVKRSLTGLTAQFEKTILWLGPAWVGALNNYTFDRIPIQRLTPHDIKAQPGAVPALITILLVIIFIALGQAWAFRVEGRMPRYLVIYGLMVGSLLIMLAIPGLDLRIHHYILALLFLPGTSFQNRPSLVYQGLLVGLFVNGVARWGFDSILQTPAELLQGFQQHSLLPAVSVLAIGASNITFNLGKLPIYDQKLDRTYDGISVLVNDVERFRGYGDDRSYWEGGHLKGSNFTWTWARHPPGSHILESNGDPQPISTLENGARGTSLGGPQLPEYFRFGYMHGSQTVDFGRAGKWDSDGRWIEMEPGPSF